MMRKKLVIIMSLIISAAAAGCAKAAEYSELGALPQDFDKKASVVCCGREYEAELRRGNDSAWEISFTAPECIEGLTITSTDGDCIFNYSGLEYFARGTALPDSGMLPLLSGAIDKVISAEDISVRKNGDTLTETGEINGRPFTATIKDNEMTELKISDCISANFSP